jgi:hypothetical protein
MDMLELESFGLRQTNPTPFYATGEAGSMLVHRDPAQSRPVCGSAATKQRTL